MARSYQVALPEAQWDLIIELLHRHEKVCLKNARMARKNGYQTVTSLRRAEEWESKAQEAVEILQTITLEAS